MLQSNGHVTSLDFHVEEDPLVTCASDALGPAVQGSKLEADPAKVAGQVFEVFLVGRAIKADDEVGAAKVFATSQLEKAHEAVRQGQYMVKGQRI